MVTETKTSDKLVKTSIKIYDPRQSPEFKKLKNQLDELVKIVNNAVIDSDEMVKKVTLDINLSTNMLKELDKLRKDIFLKDAREYTNLVNAAFNELSDPVEEMKKNTGKRITDYHNEQEKDQKIIDEENMRRSFEYMTKKSNAVDDDTGEILNDMPKQPDRIGDIETKPKTNTFAGSSNTKKVPKWKLITFADVPDSYKLLDEKKINKMVDAGLMDLPGLYIWEENDTKFRAKSIK